MPLPRDTNQLVSALRFRPGAVDTIGMRIAIAARMPEHYQQPSVFLNATLCDVRTEVGEDQLPVYRFVVDEATRDNEPVQRVLASARKRLEQTYRTYDGSDDDPMKQAVQQKMTEIPIVWLEFKDSDWIVAMGDQATAYTAEGWPEPLGEIFQLTVLK